jgi:glycosyltransferase involved in cell wall biosynthesis
MSSSSLADIFHDHPVAPVERRDPLARLKEVRAGLSSVSDTEASERLRLGFACVWDDPPEPTWSYTPWNLRTGLREVADVVDVGVQISRRTRTVLKASHARYRHGRLTTAWGSSRLSDVYNAHLLGREFSRNPSTRRCEAVLGMQVMAAAGSLPVPFFLYNDMSMEAWISAVGGPEVLASIRLTKQSILERLREREQAVYERSAGILTMSHWCARTLVEQSGISPEKIHVIHGGVSAGKIRIGGSASVGPVDSWRRPLRERTGPRRRLLFIGRQYIPFDFYRKGGDLVVAALAVLRRDYDPGITLTVVGPDTWPLPGPPPEGVRFLGPLPPNEVDTLYDSHDLFVMPSRIEPFGVVFVEALARGMPCVARDACAMPEIVTPGIDGALIRRDDKEELAGAIAAVLSDDALYESCRGRAPEIAEYFSWDRAGREAAHVISHAVR